jgi:hypothetical protein
MHHVTLRALAALSLLAATTAPAQAQDSSARDPSTLISVLAEMDARAELHSRDAGAVRLDVITPGGIFGAEFLGCEESGRDCRALRFTASLGERAVTETALHAYNDREVLCRAVRREGEVHVRYGTLLSDTQSRADLKAHIGAWQGCLRSMADLVSGAAKP